jgi:hypothetical protein
MHRVCQNTQQEGDRKRKLPIFFLKENPERFHKHVLIVAQTFGFCLFPVAP